ncbi:hypothetical protein ACCO45_009552 [Purpureocillium lilacinum]|uniref:Uncharacterized protein n=1 Tax=Purpureocillium lilacinum TaxID=33203 RepID=A0ACC4DKA2_PURLI
MLIVFPRRALARFSRSVPGEVRRAWHIARCGIKDILDETEGMRYSWAFLDLDACGASHLDPLSNREVSIVTSREIPEAAWIDVLDQVHDYLETFEVGFNVQLRYVEDIEW